MIDREERYRGGSEERGGWGHRRRLGGGEGGQVKEEVVFLIWFSYAEEADAVSDGAITVEVSIGVGNKGGATDCFSKQVMNPIRWTAPVTCEPLPQVHIAEELKKCVYRETGLTCSAGVAPNRLLAKILEWLCLLTRDVFMVFAFYDVFTIISVDIG
ncbi:hypothetical protein Syun_030888 [Stephania yunnanensis]|uniref:UmuC domain-containing protein n=1 Tax=Stephania yunnanensis TaxID=152371 RepID=A0AAP0DV52_9MAGN